MQLATEVLAKRLGSASSNNNKSELLNSYLRMFAQPLEQKTILAIAELVDKGRQQQKNSSNKVVPVEEQAAL